MPPIDFSTVVSTEPMMRDDVLRERLRAIKNLILLADEDALETQMHKLAAAGATGDARVQAIVDALRRGAHGEAVALIEAVLAEEKAPPVPVETLGETTEDTGEQHALREEVARLEARLTALEGEEADVQRNIRAFSARYRDELGPLVNKLLQMRKNRAEQSLYAKRASRTRRTAYREAEAQFERFQQVLEETGEVAGTGELSSNEQQRLKSAYRRASKLCHPDVVDPSMEEEARIYFNELRAAYQRSDLARVEEIAESLAESGFARRPGDTISADRTCLEARAERLRRRIEDVEATLDELRGSKAYAAMASVDDLDAYFDALKRRLRREIRQLKRGRGVRM